MGRILVPVAFAAFIWLPLKRMFTSPTTRPITALPLFLVLAAAAPLPPAYFRAGANVVLIDATVMDRHNRPVRGLNRNDFRLFEGKKEQAVTYFNEEEVPLSLAVVFDTSGSMESKISHAREALGAILNDANPGDEFSLITFADEPREAVAWTSDPAELQADVLFAKPHGSTSLLDAVQLAIQEMTRARNPRRAVLILSDGGDNHSRFSQSHIARLLEEADVEVYAVDMSAQRITREEWVGPELLDRLCDAAGGRYFQVEGAKALSAAATQIAREMRSRYVLGYIPLDISNDGRFHAVRVQAAHAQSKLTVFSRRGYRAPGGR